MAIVPLGHTDEFDRGFLRLRLEGVGFITLTAFYSLNRFLKAVLNLEKYVDTSSFSAWLKTIIINTCVDKLKKRKLETVSLEKYPLEISNDEDWNFDIRITKSQILEGIESLSLKYQIVVKLYLIEGYDHQEISEILNIPIKTSRTHLRRGKSILKQLLKPKEYGT